MKRGNILKVATATVLLAVVGTAVYAQDKYSLKSPSGIAFSDFRGYEDWAVVSSARTDEVLKVIVANPTMIFSFLSLGVIPALRLTNRGLVDATTFELVSPVVS